MEKAASLVITAPVSAQVVAPVTEELVHPVIGVDVTRPDPESAMVYAYIEKGCINERVEVSWDLDVSLGWRCVGQGDQAENSPSGAAAFARWELKLNGIEFTPGSEMTVTASFNAGESNTGREIKMTVQSTSLYQIQWYILASLQMMEARGSIIRMSRENCTAYLLHILP